MQHGSFGQFGPIKLHLHAAAILNGDATRVTITHVSPHERPVFTHSADFVLSCQNVNPELAIQVCPGLEVSLSPMDFYLHSRIRIRRSSRHNHALNEASLTPCLYSVNGSQCNCRLFDGT